MNPKLSWLNDLEKPMRTLIWTMMLTIAVCSLSACDKKPASKASVEQQQEEELRCPSDFGIPARPAEAPVDDILGLRLGVSLDNAILFLKCQKNRNFTVLTDDRRHLTQLSSFGAKRRDFTRIVDGVRQKLDPSERWNRGWGVRDEFHNIKEDIYLMAIGPADAETVHGIWRTENFETDKYPAAADVGKALVAKYGQPDVMMEGRNSALMQWVYDVYGRRMSKKDPNFSTCKSATSGVHDSFGWSPACGLIVAATISKASTNELLAERLSVAVMNQEAIDKAIEAANIAFEAADAQRKQDELNKAQKENASAPEL